MDILFEFYYSNQIQEMKTIHPNAFADYKLHDFLKSLTIKNIKYGGDSIVVILADEKIVIKFTKKEKDKTEIKYDRNTIIKLFNINIPQRTKIGETECYNIYSQEFLDVDKKQFTLENFKNYFDMIIYLMQHNLIVLDCGPINFTLHNDKFTIFDLELIELDQQNIVYDQIIFFLYTIYKFYCLITNVDDLQISLKYENLPAIENFFKSKYGNTIIDQLIICFTAEKKNIKSLVELVKILKDKMISNDKQEICIKPSESQWYITTRITNFIKSVLFKN